MSNWNNLLWPLENYGTVFIMFTHSKIIMRCHMEKPSCGRWLSESIFLKCFPQINHIANLQSRGEQSLSTWRSDVKCLQLQNINRGVDISNCYSYEPFFTKYYECNTWSYRKNKIHGTLYIMYKISIYCQYKKTLNAHCSWLRCVLPLA